MDVTGHDHRVACAAAVDPISPWVSVAASLVALAALVGLFLLLEWLDSRR